MRTLTIAAAAVLALTGAAFSEPLIGTWQTTKDDNGNYGHIRVGTCGDKLCGVLVKSFDSAGKEVSSEHDGRNIISATVPTGAGTYKGKVFAPDRGKTYNSKLELSGKRLKVSGCVLGICRDGGTWTKIN